MTHVKLESESTPAAAPASSPSASAAAPSPSNAAKLRRRILGGTVALAILASILVVDRSLERPWIAVALAGFLGVAGAHELFAMLARRGLAVRRGVGVAFAVVLLAGKIAIHVSGSGALSEMHPGSFALLVFGAFAIVSWAIEVVKGDADKGVEAVAYGSLGLGYVLLYSFLLDVLLEPAAPRGVEIALWLVLVSKSNDIGGYLVGNLIGGRKLAPRVSPGKTWSGSIGGALLCLAAAIGGAGVVGLALGVPTLAGFGLLIAVTTQFGDLAESLLKRACRCKDSGRLLPTFGGALDVIDSLAFAAPSGYAFLCAAGALN